VLKDVLIVACDAFGGMKDGAMFNDGFLKSEEGGSVRADTFDLLKGCFPFENFVNLGDFPGSFKLSKGRFRLVACKEN
jgi:hypothetical protein